MIDATHVMCGRLHSMCGTLINEGLEMLLDDRLEHDETLAKVGWAGGRAGVGCLAVRPDDI